jgi:predicted nuclease of predicted toxin-antitoxin system
VAEQVRFYCDTHISRAVAVGLRRHGIDVVRAQEVGLADANDDMHIAFALIERRVIVTQDAGFIQQVAQSEKNYGVAFCEQGSRSIGEMIAALDLIYQVLEFDDMQGRVEYI